MASRGAGRWRTAMYIGAGATALFLSPMIIHFTSTGPMISTEKSLKPEAVRRGAFNNSGSRDIGPDPNWVDGQYVRQRGKGPTAN